MLCMRPHVVLPAASYCAQPSVFWHGVQRWQADQMPLPPGKLDEAEALHRRALHSRELVLGQHHPDTAASLTEMARVLQDQGASYVCSDM